MPILEKPKVANCPLCNSKGYEIIQKDVRDYEYGTKESYKWIKCNGCKLIRIDPMPSLEILSRAYPANYHAYVVPKSKITQKLQAISRKKIAKKIALSFPTAASILEIGCSTGLLLEAIGNYGNYKLFGVEYKIEAANEANKRGIKTWNGTFEDAPIPNEAMDLIILQHVIEHVFNPIEIMHKIFTSLKPGGKVIGELPNIDSWDASFFGKYWGGGHAPRHIWFFTPKTLKKMLEHSGFENIKIKPCLHTGHWALSIQNYLRRNKKDTSDLTSGRTWYYPFLLVATIIPNIIQMPALKTGVISFEAQKI